MAGRPPKEKSFANMLNIALTAKGVSGETKLREVAEVLVSKALEGESWAVNMVADRTDGKPFQQIAVTGEEGGPIAVSMITRKIVDANGTGN